MKKIETLIEDITNLLENSSNHKINKKNLDLFLEQMRFNILRQFEDRNDSNTLRLSNIGYPDRRLWFEMNHKKEAKDLIGYNSKITFMYGDFVEALLMFLIREAGHEITNEQKEVNIKGVLGHIDLEIDEDVVDIKSASPRNFGKFVSGLIHDEDEYGYIVQLSSYVHALNKEVGYFLVCNKVTGELYLLKLEGLELINPENRIERLKKLVQQKEPPVPFCYAPIPEGKSGNLKLNKLCEWCPFNKECWKDSNDGKGLRWFKYSNGLVPFVKVVKEPKVEEVYET